ncbi:MAG: cupin domain-containing protein [Thermoleophilaceae bacterium]|nr:cupin domain-containing protein [Thermoleophilaceae bacterium]
MTKIRGAVLGAALLGVAAIGANVLPSAAQQQPQPIASEPLTGRAVFTDDVDLKLKIKLQGEKRALHGWKRALHGWKHALHGGKRVVVKAKDPSRTFVARFTVQPGAQFPWHTHPGPVIVNVTQGELVYVAADDCVERSYPAGTAFVDPGHGHAHTAYNPTGAPTVFVATFFEAPAAPAPLLIPADAPDDCEV